MTSTSHVASRGERRERRPWLVVTIVAALAVAVAVGAFLLTRGGDDLVVSGPAQAPFRIVRAAQWRPLSGVEMARLREQEGQSSPIAVLRRSDGAGTLIVRRRGPVRGELSELSAQVTRELERRVPDFRRVASRVVELPAGPAAFVSYARERAGTVNGLVVVPAGSRSYVVNTVSPAGRDEVAREVGAMISSFDLPPFPE